MSSPFAMLHSYNIIFLFHIVRVSVSHKKITSTAHSYIDAYRGSIACIYDYITRIKFFFSFLYKKKLKTTR